MRYIYIYIYNRAICDACIWKIYVASLEAHFYVPAEKAILFGFYILFNSISTYEYCICIYRNSIQRTVLQFTHSFRPYCVPMVLTHSLIETHAHNGQCNILFRYYYYILYEIFGMLRQHICDCVCVCGVCDCISTTHMWCMPICVCMCYYSVVFHFGIHLEGGLMSFRGRTMQRIWNIRFGERALPAIFGWWMVFNLAME